MFFTIGSSCLEYHRDWQNPGRTYNYKESDWIATHDDISDYCNYHASMIKSAYPIDDSHYVIRLKSGSILDIEIAYSGTSSDWLINNFKSAEMSFEEKYNLLYTMKMSHKFKDSIHFEKTRSDIMWMRSKGAYIPENLVGFYEMRFQESIDRPPVKLNVSKQEFFSGDSVPYIIDHDLLHSYVAHIVNGTSVPTYNKILKDGQDVLTSYSKWNAISNTEKLYCVLEEAIVIAIERGIIPYKKFNADVKEIEKLLGIALNKICTTLCSGYFREFAYEEYPKHILLSYAPQIQNLIRKPEICWV